MKHNIVPQCLSGLFLLGLCASPVTSAEPSTVKANSPKNTTTIDAQSQNSKRKGKSINAWLNRMKKKVAKSQSKHNKIIAVAAVRGDESSDVPPLYWKGKESSGAINLPELTEFDSALELALNGDSVQAKSKLESFVATYPSSPLVGDAKETLSMINSAEITP